MKTFIKDFMLRGLIAAGGGPIVLAIIYGILGATGTISSLSPQQVCLGFLTVTLLAFLASGINAIYQIERLPLPYAIGLHGGFLYMVYILIYLLNGWLSQQLASILVFTTVFLSGYALVWLIIYAVTKHKANQLNQELDSLH